jgi:hypothetical protein
MSGLQGDEAAHYHAAFTTLSREMTGQVFRREGCANSNQPGIAWHCFDDFLFVTLPHNGRRG